MAPQRICGERGRGRETEREEVLAKNSHAHVNVKEDVLEMTSGSSDIPLSLPRSATPEETGEDLMSPCDAAKILSNITGNHWNVELIWRFLGIHPAVSWRGEDKRPDLLTLVVMLPGQGQGVVARHKLWAVELVIVVGKGRTASVSFGVVAFILCRGLAAVG